MLGLLGEKGVTSKELGRRILVHRSRRHRQLPPCKLLPSLRKMRREPFGSPEHHICLLGL